MSLIAVFVFLDLSCPECAPFTYGDNCLSDCSCVQNNTECCDSVTGQCTCQSGWTSSDCSVDIDECYENAMWCPDYSTCYNTNGSYECVCNDGLVFTQLGECQGWCAWDNKI